MAVIFDMTEKSIVNNDKANPFKSVRGGVSSFTKVLERIRGAGNGADTRSINDISMNKITANGITLTKKKFLISRGQRWWLRFMKTGNVRKALGYPLDFTNFAYSQAKWASIPNSCKICSLPSLHFQSSKS